MVADLVAAGHEATGHSRSTGVDLLTGQGLDDALRGAEVVVDVTNSPTFDDASLDFFRTSVTNLLAAAEKAGVGHIVTLSIVGVDRVPEMAYYRAKTLQEDLVKAGSIPYSIVRATQFMEFVEPTMSWTTDGDVVRLPATPIQPITSAEVAAAVADAAGTRLSTARATSPAPTSSRSTSSADHGGGHRRRSSPTTRPACSPSSRATRCSPRRAP